MIERRRVQDIDVDAEGNVYVLDENPYVPDRKGTHSLVRKIDTSGQVSTLFWGDPPYLGGQLAGSRGMAVTPTGEVYLANTGRHQIVKVLGFNQLMAVAGTGKVGYLDGPSGEAAFNAPGALALSPGGALVVMDQADSSVRIVLPEDWRSLRTEACTSPTGTTTRFAAYLPPELCPPWQAPMDPAISTDLKARPNSLGHGLWP